MPDYKSSVFSCILLSEYGISGFGSVGIRKEKISDSLYGAVGVSCDGYCRAVYSGALYLSFYGSRAMDGSHVVFTAFPKICGTAEELKEIFCRQVHLD